MRCAKLDGMIPLRLAESQVRLLLCTPTQRSSGNLYWRCGCTAHQCAYRKYEVLACADHASLLSEVREGDDRLYDSITAPLLLSRNGPFA